MRHPRVSATLFAVLFLLFTLPIVSCGGSGSPQNMRTSQPPGGGTAPSSAIVIGNIQQNNWLTCGACGNSGGTGSIPNFSFTLGITSPSEDGSATQFSIAASVAFTNAYFYQQHSPVQNQFGYLGYEFDLYVPSGSETSPQAIEFESQQQLSGWIYNFSWQADYATNTWRIFDYGAKHWDSTAIALQRFTPGTWHHILAEFHNDSSAHLVFHDTLTIDGVRTPVNIQHNAFFSGGNDQFTNAVQLDSNSVPTAYSLYVDKMSLTYN